jgi:hypothetical protein
MKKHSNSHKRAGKTACMVSAAALMLGVSHAATIGFNFQVNWTEHGAPAYTGKPATATAFGIPTNGWENLAPLPTGYTSTNSGPFFTNQVIDTTTSTGGLNPLPQGSVSLTWSCTAANSSGFAGYGIPYGGPSPNPGEEEVYYGFLRDEANIYTSPVGGPIPYNVSVSGLRSLFPSNPYVIEIISSTDTGNVITNTFITSLTTTQTVTYNVSQPGIGIMGGLSTLTAPMTNDSISIFGAPAVSHNTGFAIASTIAGFIVTDKPVVSMSPQPAVVGSGDTVIMRAIAVGVPPLAMQWRKNGAPIVGATNLSYTNASAISSANYDVVVTNNYGSTTSKVASITVDTITLARGPNYTPDSKPSGTPHDAELLGATIVSSSTDSNGTNRLGVAQFAATNSDQIVVSGATTDFDSTSGTIMMWVRSAATITNVSATLFDRLTSAGGLSIVQLTSGNIEVSSPGGGIDTGGTIADGNWHHVAVTFSITDGSVQCYFDGQPDNSAPLGAWTWPVRLEIDLGLTHNTTAYSAYDGQMDDVRFYSRILTAAEVGSVFTNGSLIDTSALKLQLNFASAKNPGLTATWLLGTDILQSAPNVTGPYADVPFAASPYRFEPLGKQQYFRYRHTKSTITTNPTDM